MLREITKKTTNPKGCHLYVENKKNKFIEMEIRLVIDTGGGGRGALVKGGLKGQTSSYKINKF